MNRPESLNSLTAGLCAALKAAFADCEDDNDIRVVNNSAARERPSAPAATCARYYDCQIMRRRANTYTPPGDNGGGHALQSRYRDGQRRGGRSRF